MDLRPSMKPPITIIDFSTLLPQHLDRYIQQWLEDDLPSFDVGGMVVGSEVQSAQLFMKTTSGCVFAGKPFFERVFSLLGCTVRWETFDSVEGAHISLGSSIDGCKVLLATVTGPVNSILRGERTALNILSRCSGVATAAAKAVQIARDLGWEGFIAGTRKTTPGFRMVEKYGLLVGGAATHRLDLSQMVMLKDNHIWSTGSISSAVALARAAAGFSQKIEVECQSKEEAIEAATAGADIVMLDNFQADHLKMAAKEIKEKFPNLLIEASGGITNETLKDYLSEHVDIVSQGNLTQGYQTIDFSLKIIH